MIRTVVDREICMGSGQCTIYAPNTFELAPEMKARVMDPYGDPPETVRCAVSACPSGALSLDSDDRQEHQ